MEQEARRLRRLMGAHEAGGLRAHPLRHQLRREPVLGERPAVEPRRRGGGLGRREMLLRSRGELV
ncbi:unnamed protein product [Linum tenue]|uniref:Uncharacterized protein n=1 Tax=Linum tenue TaxID=586396 RepID=A0AAV0JJ17_9ROSI|nr:unnamed protein product [Linum tenue]